MRTLEEFDFTFQPGLSAVRVRELANLAFLDHATNVLFIGGQWRGQDAPGHQQRLAHLRRVDLLIVDELGYFPMDGRRRQSK